MEKNVNTEKVQYLLNLLSDGIDEAGTNKNLYEQATGCRYCGFEDWDDAQLSIVSGGDIIKNFEIGSLPKNLKIDLLTWLDKCRVYYAGELVHFLKSHSLGRVDDFVSVEPSGPGISANDKKPTAKGGAGK